MRALKLRCASRKEKTEAMPSREREREVFLYSKFPLRIGASDSKNLRQIEEIRLKSCDGRLGLLFSRRILYPSSSNDVRVIDLGARSQRVTNSGAVTGENGPSQSFSPISPPGEGVPSESTVTLLDPRSTRLRCSFLKAIALQSNPRSFIRVANDVDLLIHDNVYYS